MCRVYLDAIANAQKVNAKVLQSSNEVLSMVARKYSVPYIVNFSAASALNTATVNRYL